MPPKKRGANPPPLARSMPERLRYRFPTRLVQCSHCGYTGFAQAGRSRSGEFRYCRCHNCGRTFTIAAHAVERIDDRGNITIEKIRTI
jgi:predicted nucleic-acid-binding Zn-ribbon protein